MPTFQPLEPLKVPKKTPVPVLPWTGRPRKKSTQSVTIGCRVTTSINLHTYIVHHSERTRTTLHGQVYGNNLFRKRHQSVLPHTFARSRTKNPLAYRPTYHCRITTRRTRLCPGCIQGNPLICKVASVAENTNTETWFEPVERTNERTNLRSPREARQNKQIAPHPSRPSIN